MNQHTMTRRLGISLIAAGLLLCGPDAAARTPSSEMSGLGPAQHRYKLPKKVRSYVERTPYEQQLRANKLFQQGNRRFEKRRLDDAIRLYRQAYRLWPHPRILFNMAVNLGYLSNPLGSALMFRKVLEYGPTHVGSERYQQAAERYQELMAQLSTLQVACTERGTEVFVDGKRLGEAPLDRTVTLTPGTHMVSAKLKGKVPYSASLNLKPGRHRRVNVRMREFSDVVRYRLVSRYHWWIPSLVSGVAALTVGLGGGLWGSGVKTIDDLRHDIDQAFRTANGGMVIYDTAAEDRAKAMQVGGQVLLGVGLAATAAAVVLWILRKKRVRYTVEAASSDATPAGK